MKETIEKNVVTSKQENKQQENKQQEATMNLESIKTFIINYMKEQQAAKLEAEINFAKSELEAAKAELEAASDESAKAKAELKIKGFEADIEGMIQGKAAKAEAEAEKQAEAEKAEALDKAELEALESAAKAAKAEAVKQALEKAVNDKKAEIESKAEAKKAEAEKAEARLFSEAVVYCFPELNLASVKIAKVTASNTTKAAKASNSDKYTYNDAIAEALTGGKTLKASAICEAIQKAGKLEAINTNPDGWKRAVSSALLNTNKYTRNENHEYSLLG